MNLYDSLPEASRVKTNSAVIRVQHKEDRVLVESADGCFYEGDLVVGADGVHSVMRSEMLRLANSLQGQQFLDTGESGL